LARLAAEAAGTETIEIEGRDVDVPLSELGERQSRAVGRWLKQQPESQRPSIILSSPYARAMQTMQHLSREVANSNLQCLVDERLREKEFGELNRFTKAGIELRFPEEARRRAELGKFYYRPPGGESWCDVALRVRACLQDLRLGHAGERVLIVAHQVIVLCVRYVIERLDERQLLDIDSAGDVANCSITSFELVNADGWERLELLDYNFVAPLEESGEPVTAAPDPAVVE